MKGRKRENVYALYKGDKFIAMGTTDELYQQLGIKYKTLMFYQTPSYIKRTSEKNGKRLIKVE